ncbi:hypothetical protein COT99_02445 [Candidatus Falkowbacteria bacterium CG10_big_fil_rev_8_21_14_0_10_43_10]|uniref:Uncharacterized protein n=1 Tax=Candidatus Falkowbacteria bacterium CG10_big_fil_rev_8_21_14_0_10_43_10 TaxID=1974567 RepID=A0A2H0V232_9BACT|nr:MAG: hypothetical protein COT99_02445 [Candidatus Falkowbacteria bacterium CG10_big_fil_rev_8_21_14_0_10_43_10]
MSLDNVPLDAALVLELKTTDRDGPGPPTITLSNPDTAPVISAETRVIGNTTIRTLVVFTNQSGIIYFQVKVGDGLNQRTELVTYTVTNKVATPTPTVTRVPTAMPTNTPRPFATVRPATGTIIVTDDIYSLQDLTGGHDRDADNNRVLALWWNPVSDAVDNYIYAFVDNATQALYVGRTGTDNSGRWEWRPSLGRQFLNPFFGLGPAPGARYRFWIYPTTASGPLFDRVQKQPEPVLFLSQEQPLPVPAMAANGIVVTDNEASRENLVNGFDVDPDGYEKMTVWWNVDQSDSKNVHIYISDNGNRWAYLGQTGNGTDSHFTWRTNTNPLSNWLFRNGPQNGHFYQFAVYALTRSGSPHHYGPFIANGMVFFMEEGQEFPSPTFQEGEAVVVTDNLLSAENIVGATDTDVSGEEDLTIWYSMPHPDTKGVHVYVSVDNDDFVYLGRNERQGGSGNFYWSVNSSEIIAPAFRSGPEAGHDYAFRIFAFSESGDPLIYGPFTTAGAVSLLSE